MEKEEPWKGFYDIECASKETNADSWLDDTDYYIIDKVSKERIHGPYRDLTYAKKQAKRKYQKLVRKMERMLMS